MSPSLSFKLFPPSCHSCTRSLRLSSWSLSNRHHDLYRTLIPKWSWICLMEASTVIQTEAHFLLVESIKICIIKVHLANTNNIHHSSTTTLYILWEKIHQVIIIAIFWSISWSFSIYYFVILNFKEDTLSFKIYKARLILVMQSSKVDQFSKSWCITPPRASW